MENEQYDFYTYGMRVAKDMNTNIKKLVEEIGKKYGEQAKLEFESGVAVAIPTYANTYENSINNPLPKIKDGVINTSVDNYKENTASTYSSNINYDNNDALNDINKRKKFAKEYQFKGIKSDDEIRDDKDFFLKIISNNEMPYALRYASERLKDDKEVVLSAVKIDGLNFTNASERLQNDREVVLEAIKSSPFAFKYVNDTFKNDREVVFEAIKSYGPNIQYVGEELQNDREIALEAVKSHGQALKYVNDTFKNDKEIVLAAVKSYGQVFKYVSDEFKNDKDIILAAITQITSTSTYASNNLKDIKDIKEYLSQILQLNNDNILEETYNSIKNK